MAYQTLDGETAQPLDVIPATADADPGCKRSNESNQSVAGELEINLNDD